jgi:hypothetical protein
MILKKDNSVIVRKDTPISAADYEIGTILTAETPYSNLETDWVVVMYEGDNHFLNLRNAGQTYISINKNEVVPPAPICTISANNAKRGVAYLESDGAVCYSMRGLSLSTSYYWVRISDKEATILPSGVLISAREAPSHPILYVQDWKD